MPTRTQRRSPSLPRATAGTGTPAPHATPSVPPGSTPSATPTRVPAARRIAQVAANDPGLPLGILGVVALFLLLQNRIDRRDPKLTATRSAQQEELDFDPPTGTPPSPDR